MATSTYTAMAIQTWVFHASQRHRVILTGLWPGQHDRLVATQAGRFVDRMRIDPPVLEVGLGPCDKEGLRPMQGMEPGEVDIAPIHDVEAAGLEGDLVEDIHIVQLALRDMDEGRNIAARESSSVWSFTAPLRLRKRAQGNSTKHRSMVVESST